MRTDLVPNIEFDALRLQVGDGDVAFRSDHLAERSADYIRGVRLNSVPLLMGSTPLTVSLFRSGELVVERRANAQVRTAGQVVTVVITRDCRGVECPATGNPSFDSCLGGRCVDPRCTLETPEFCPDPDCSNHGDCEVASCADGYCSSGVCFAAPDRSRCGASEYCDGTLGCMAEPTPGDAGLDGGIDASMDAPTDVRVVPGPVNVRSPWNGFSTGSIHASASMNVLRPRLTWELVEGADHYEVHMTRECALSDFESCSFDAPELANVVSDTTFQPEEPLPVALAAPVGSRYFWRVRACSTEDECSEWSPVRYMNVGRDDHDYNGDGYADLLVGADQHDTPESREGAVYLYFGSEAGLAADPSLSFDNPLDQMDGRFGTVASAGDVNGDGFADVLVGAPTQASPELVEGSAYLFFGGLGGPSTVPDVSMDNPLDRAGGEFGHSLAGAGDVNGDGFADVVVGARGGGSAPGVLGAAFVFFGSESGPSDTPDVSLDYEENTINTQFGSAVSGAGDFNGDGYPDVVVAARGAGGSLQVFLGGVSLATRPSLTIDNVTGMTYDSFGSALASSSDINGDGYADLIVGASNEDGLTDHEGVVHLFYGGETGLRDVPNVTFNNPLRAPNARFGGSLSTGDVNGDGIADIVIGAEHQVNAMLNEGAAYLYVGGLGGPSTTPDVSFENVVLLESTQFGSAVTSVDINGDGFADVVVGAPFQEDRRTGGAHVFHGAEAGPAVTPDESLSSPQDDLLGHFGGSLALGSVCVSWRAG